MYAKLLIWENINIIDWIRHNFAFSLLHWYKETKTLMQRAVFLKSQEYTVMYLSNQSGLIGWFSMKIPNAEFVFPWVISEHDTDSTSTMLLTYEISKFWWSSKNRAMNLNLTRKNTLRNAHFFSRTQGEPNI